MSQQLFVRAQLMNKPFVTAWYQPIVPAVSTVGAILLQKEKTSRMIQIGISIWLVATWSRLSYDALTQYDDQLFVKKFYLLLQVLFLSTGVLMQKYIIQNNSDKSLLVLGFHIYLYGTIMSGIFYTVKYIAYIKYDPVPLDPPEVFNGYLNGQWFRNVSVQVPSIFTMLVISEAFRYAALMYINKKGHISKVTLYGSLHGFYIIAIYSFTEAIDAFDIMFFTSILVAYWCLFWSKIHYGRIERNKASNKKNTIKFK